MYGISKNVVFIRVYSTHCHNCLIHLLFDNLVIRQLFSQDCNLSFETTHFVFVVRFGLIKLSFDNIELLSEHVILVLVHIQVGQCFLINTVYSFQLFRFNFELNTVLGKVTIKFPVEISNVNH